MDIKYGATYTYQGIEVEVIGLDSDPSADVLVVRCDNPDVALEVSRESLTK